MQGQERDDEGEESYFMKGRGQNHGWEGWAGAGSQRGWGPWGWMAEAEGAQLGLPRPVTVSRFFSVIRDSVSPRCLLLL